MNTENDTNSGSQPGANSPAPSAKKPRPSRAKPKATPGAEAPRKPLPGENPILPQGAVAGAPQGSDKIMDSKIIEEKGVSPAPSVKGAPVCPEMDPLLGDKTPAVVEWYFRYAPEEAATKYAGRKFQRGGEA